MSLGKKHMVFGYLNLQSFDTVMFGNKIFLGYNDMVLSNDYVILDRVKFIVNLSKNQHLFFDAFFKDTFLSFFNLNLEEGTELVKEWCLQKHNTKCQDLEK